MNIFIASLRTWAPTFVYLTSATHTIDFYGCSSNFLYNTNVNYFGSYFNNNTRVLEFLKNNWKKYDLIIMPDFEWQVDLDFQILRKIIKTPVLTPSIEANQLEGNKLFSKKLFNHLNIPTSPYLVYESVDQLEFLEKEKFVFKLANSIIHSGFQTRIFSDSSYKNIIPLYFKRGYRGEAYIEDFIEGKEAVLHFLCNGTGNLYLGSSRDYKKISNGDTGINVSSTGSYSTVEYISKDIITQVTSYVTKIQSYIDYVGIMCVGIIISNNVPVVLEINVRPGVPEFNTLILTLDANNLIENLYSAATGNPFSQIKTLPINAVTVQLFHQQYSWMDKPDSKFPTNLKSTDLIITNFEKSFHQHNYAVSISAVAPSRREAADKIYSQMAQVDMGDYKFRSDIGYLE